VDLDHHLRWVRRNHHDVRKGLHQDSSFLLVGFAEIIAGLHGFRESRLQVVCLSYPHTIGAASAEIGQLAAWLAAEQTSGLGALEAVHSLCDHLGQCVFARPLCSCKYQGVWEAVVREHLPESQHNFGIAVKVRKSHQLITGSSSRSRTAWTIFACVASAGGRASISATRCGSRSAISRYLS